MLDQSVAGFLGGFGRKCDINAVWAIHKDLAVLGLHVTRLAEQLLSGHATQTRKLQSGFRQVLPSVQAASNYGVPHLGEPSAKRFQTLMNLHDIVKRRDRNLVVEQGSVEPAHKAGDGGFIGGKLAPNTRLKLVNARKFTALRLGAPLGWDVIEGDAQIEVSDDEIVASTENGATIRSGGFWTSRGELLPFAVGTGIEVGPGNNPHVKPSDKVAVSYLEDVEKDAWLARYHLPQGQESDELWKNYLVGDARDLEVAGDASLDFIYSSHVFEHLMNPLGTLANWSRKLKPGGSVLAIVPDCRYCFDLRQEPSTLAEIEQEFTDSQWSPTRAKYEKWCLETEVSGDPDKLFNRNYSIHFHYYTPDVFAQLARKAIELGLFAGFQLWTDPNAKDFGVRLIR